IDLDELRAAIRPDTIMVAVMAANNEIGVLQPLQTIGQICRENEVFFFSDVHHH
ncbi:MAG TPA: aminotransferase class V-fold PLP-dependent enzyme, partial [Sneathiellales bacterium]|nr:aminotransferase class V-fold PLP-dependent enzyme [Sneathiellales bacterium]